MPLITIEQAIDDIKAGKIVILVDDEDRENEGDLTIAAEKVTPEAINFMSKYGRGLICLSLTKDKCTSLDLPPMVDNNTSPFQTGFTVSIEARCGVTTGISAADRATTILTAMADNAKPGDLVRPGHVFPLQAREGGVEALRSKPAPGPTPKLSDEQLETLPGLLAKGAMHFGFRENVWTQPRVAWLIQREFGVTYHPAHVGRILKRLEWSRQKPVERATQRDEEAIERWRTEKWLEVEKKPGKRGER